MQPYPLKYQPKSVDEVKGQNTPLAKLLDYVQNYQRQKKKAVLVYGPIGCGKTCSIYALAQQLNLETIEINSSEIRNEEAINAVVGSALQQQSLFFQGKLVLIDEIDNFSGRKDRGGVGALNKLIQKSPFPVVLTANEAYDKKLAPLRKTSELIEFNRLSYVTVSGLLKEICEKEGINFDEKAVNTLARIADGDVRGALIDLQLLTQDKRLDLGKLEHLSDRKKTDTIFNAMRLIFKASAVENSLKALDNLDLPVNELFLWLDENLPKEYTAPADLCLAYDKLSRADIFNARIRRQQHWRFLVYINNLLTAGISSSKSVRNSSVVSYTRTKRILKLWQAKMKYAKKKDLALKIAEKVHSSQKEVIKQMPYYKIILKSFSQEDLVDGFDFSLDEAGWIRK